MLKVIVKKTKHFFDVGKYYEHKQFDLLNIKKIFSDKQINKLSGARELLKS